MQCKGHGNRRVPEIHRKAILQKGRKARELLASTQKTRHGSDMSLRCHSAVLGERATCISMDSGFKSSGYILSMANAYSLGLVQRGLRGLGSHTRPRFCKYF